MRSDNSTEEFSFDESSESKSEELVMGFDESSTPEFSAEDETVIANESDDIN